MAEASSVPVTTSVHIRSPYFRSLSLHVKEDTWSPSHVSTGMTPDVIVMGLRLSCAVVDVEVISVLLRISVQLPVKLPSHTYADKVFPPGQVSAGASVPLLLAHVEDVHEGVGGVGDVWLIHVLVASSYVWSAVHMAFGSH